MKKLSKKELKAIKAGALLPGCDDNCRRGEVCCEGTYQNPSHQIQAC